MMQVERFEIEVPQARLADLRDRLDRTRFPSDFANDDWSYGVNGRYLRELVDYWRTAHDWRAEERSINSFDHSRTHVDDVPVHFLRAPGRGPAPMPIILSHGWPSPRSRRALCAS